MANKLNEIDAVILCGGLGKRLQGAVKGTPKVMADVDGRPFLDMLIDDLEAQGIRRIILATGHKAEAVESYYQGQERPARIVFSREETPLGTGGGLKWAEPQVASTPFFVLNGDSYCAIDLSAVLACHTRAQARATIVVSKKEDVRDFGSIVLDQAGRIIDYKEKANGPSAYVNAGIYCFNKDIFALIPWGNPSSLEFDLFPQLVHNNGFGYVTEKPFFDIGTPERYTEARKHLRHL